MDTPDVYVLASALYCFRDLRTQTFHKIIFTKGTDSVRLIAEISVDS